ncbi:MAG: DUF4929 domain-containing protein [Bacteroidales bacterium]|nr:DUF4929 domain-containing protein [Bacteroidales bacterium]
MKKIFLFCYITAALLSLAGCEETGNDFTGTNYIYLETKDGKTTLFETDSEPLTVEVMLTKALEEDLQITFELAGPEGVVELSGNPLTIKAGEKTASFSVVSLNANVLESSATYRIGISSLLPEGVQLKEPLQFVVSPMTSEALTDEQKAILDAYKTASGVDLAKYIGAVNVSVEYVGFDNENEVPLDPVTFTGKTLITLSESSTSELPVLKMLSNPMGIQDKMYATLRAMTVENSDWCDAEYYPDNTGLMNAINWNAESQEVFSMSLDGIKVNSDKTIEFLGAGADQYGDEIVIVPFEYDFTAFEREKKAVADGTFVKQEEYAFDCTANPAYHVNNTTIEYDYCEYGEEGNYVEASASVSDESMIFTFCVYMCNNDYDYTRIVATYTPNN